MRRIEYASLLGGRSPLVFSMGQFGDRHSSRIPPLQKIPHNWGDKHGLILAPGIMP
ncbi:hypothetical protein VB712_02540 [Spirulina sp. CCNP1310]|uniref:hypothetical protein n=1 Tax=Spirulina sp. CCNP1310 TaxID=3110249 RepID=UPI002B202DB8|nr:hypothetical protein [Spirulina sp. CCNP1310]MEA5418084.1 hypothetical protein [Spirulina sp. CCNP1310]